MASFPSIYRAKAMSVNGLVVQAFVPQVFGEVAIQVTTFLGGPPVGPSMGWVMFQGGNPEFPVWAGNLASGGDGGGGTGADEVWIGDDPPLDPGMELWYDSNAAAPPMPASLVAFTPAGTIAATNVQAAIEEVVTDAAVVPAWIAAPAFQNGWVNYGSGYQVAQYRKVGDVVQIRGLVKSGTVSSLIFVLPVGYRPPAPLQFAEDNGGKYGAIEVSAVGNVVQLNVAGVTNAVLNIQAQFSVTA